MMPNLLYSYEGGVGEGACGALTKTEPSSDLRLNGLCDSL